MRFCRKSVPIAFFFFFFSFYAMFWLTCAQSAPVRPVIIGQNFTGLNYNNFTGIPPDPNGAIEPRHFVEFIAVPGGDLLDCFERNSVIAV